MKKSAPKIHHFFHRSFFTVYVLLIWKWGFALKFALKTSILAALSKAIPQGKRRLDRDSSVSTGNFKVLSRGRHHAWRIPFWDVLVYRGELKVTELRWQRALKTQIFAENRRFSQIHHSWKFKHLEGAGNRRKLQISQKTEDFRRNRRLAPSP